MIRKIGRKGEDTALKNFISIIIAVIGIVAVVYGIVKVVNIFTNQENTNAKHTLENIADRLIALKPGEQSTFLITGFNNAINWRFAAWSKDEDGRPDKCFFKSCLCVCPRLADVEISASCQSNGFCKTTDYEKINLIPQSEQGQKYNSIAFRLPKNVEDVKIEITGDANTMSANIYYENDEEVKFIDKITGK